MFSPIKLIFDMKICIMYRYVEDISKLCITKAKIDLKQIHQFEVIYFFKYFEVSLSINLICYSRFNGCLNTSELTPTDKLLKYLNVKFSFIKLK